MKRASVSVTTSPLQCLSVVSVVLEAIKALVDSLWTSEGLKCAITAPTDLAAFNVGGMTIHRLFQLPIEHEGKEAGYWSLSKDAQKVMKTTLRSLKLLVIDRFQIFNALGFEPAEP